ncbi:uncharacterized protein LOC103023384 isoform X1 [Astyanax mexicanus]|uniref:uncharacterized protein LOC103023384 isoform X1 n=1 Tax=Astyanax mexicanus TaxID=7994 RepID=UPI0020CAD439|nr:uncharacterized protein LOC103023384 isoform X1 [Astyanax mexicanus]
MSPVGLLLLRDYLCVMLLLISIFSGECQKIHQGQLCKSACSASLNVPKGHRHTYRYSTTTTSSLKGPSSAGSQLAFDCVVDIDVLPGCPDRILRIRNPQIKQSSLKKENSVLRLKNIREALEKNPLRFLLQGGKVIALCPQEAEQVWTLNIKRAVLSMLQTSRTGRVRETMRETDVFGTCMSTYEQKGSLLVKTRHLQQCLKERVNAFWWQSVPLQEDTTVNASLRCTQLYGTAVMDRVNCTETMVLVPLSGSLDAAQTSTVSTLNLLRTLKDIQIDSGLQDDGYLANLRFEVETLSPGRGGGARSVQEVSSTVRRLCAQSADHQQQSELFLNLALHLRTLSLQQLKDVWQEVSFKCRDDWQPFLEALPACGSEACVHFSTDLVLNDEISQEHISLLLSTVAFTPRPSAAMIRYISQALLKLPQIRLKAVLGLSSLVHRICRREPAPCSQIPEVQQFVLFLKESLVQGCGERGSWQVTELLYILKAVENIGLAAEALIPQLNDCIHNQSAALELRLAAVQAFRRIPCTSPRDVLVWVYQQHQENVEVRITAYQQLMNCPSQDVFSIIRNTLRNETSTQVGSFVWSHLVNIMKTEDPLKKHLMESLPHDIISKDFEAEPWKYSSYMDFTMDAGPAIANMEGALVYSPASFLPRSAMANVTVHVLGRSFNVLEVALRMENAESLLWRTFGEGHRSSPVDNSDTQTESTSHTSHGKKRNKRNEKTASDQKERVIQNDDCTSSKSSLLKAKFTGQKERQSDFRCWISVKMFGTDLTFMTCNELLGQLRELSLRMAGVTVKLLQGQEVKLTHRTIMIAEELVLPSLSGLPIKLSINMSSSYSLWVKGSANLKDWSQFSLAGHIKPNAFIGLSARMGVDGAFGRVGLEWVTQVRTSTSLDGGVYVHNGQSLKMVLNTPEDVMDVLSFSSRMYRVSGESKEELTALRNLKEKTTCTPKTLSKLVGWQLCSDVTYPVSLIGRGFPPAGPVLFTLRFQKLDRGLQKYLLEAAYAFTSQKNSWMPLEANLLIFLGTPQSTIPRDVSLDLSFSPRRLVLKIVHPLKTLLIQGLLDELNGHWSGRAEVLVDDIYHYYLKGLIETVSLPSEKRTHYQLEAKVAADGRPVILSVNVTHGLSRKISVTAKLRNVFSRDASFSVQLERRQDDGRRQYSVDTGLLLPSLLSTRILGLVEQSGAEWSSGLRIRYGVPDSPIMHECHMSQNLKDEVESVEEGYSMRVDHELQCSQITLFNHKIQLRHERSPVHIQSSLDLSYGKQWNQGSNKQRVLLSQSIRNQSGESLTSYALEFSLRVPEKGLNYRTQLLHSHMKRRKSESSTHLKVNYNDQIPLVAGLHWKDMSAKASLRKWDGSFNMDTPWVYVYLAHKLTQPQHGTTQFTSEITTRKLVTIRNLALEGLYREKNRDREGHLHLFTPTVTYLKVGGWGALGKRRVNASCSISTAWTPAIKGEISLNNGKQVKSLDLSSSYGKLNHKISATLNIVEKKLKKNEVMMRMTFSEMNSPYLEIEISGKVEEMRKDRNLYQKRWVLHFRQPFKFLPESLLLQETFTVDLHKGVYILESKSLLQNNRKAIHVLTLGYRPQNPFVCSSLIHSLYLENIPHDSEICISVHSNQTVQELQGRILTAKTEKLVVLGQVQLHGEQGITIKANLSQLLQLKFPTTMSLDVDLLRNHNSSVDFAYTAKGKLTTDAKRYYNAYLSAERSPAGYISSSVYLESNGKKIATLDSSLANILEMDLRGVGFNVSFEQTLLPELTADGLLRLGANLSSDRLSVLWALGKKKRMIQAQLSAALIRNPNLHLSFSGDLIIPMNSYTILPQVSSLAGLLNKSNDLTEGQLTVSLDSGVYGVKLRHSHEDTGCEDKMSECESARLCVLAEERSLCMNISTSFIQHGQRGLQAQLHHSFPWLLSAAGLPFNSTAGVFVNRSEDGLLTEVELHAGFKELKIRLQRGVHNSTGTTGHLLVNFTGESSQDHLRGVCYTQALDQTLLVNIWVNLNDSTGFELEKPDTSSLSLEIQGHHLSSSTGLKVNVSHNISSLKPYIPFVFHAKSQLNHSSSSLEAAAELLVGSSLMCFEGQVGYTKLGFKQVLDVYHAFPQLASFPSTVLVHTVYAGQNDSHVLKHQTQWMHQDSAGPAEKTGASDEPGSQKHGWGLELRLERKPHSRRADVLVDWTMSGQQQQNESKDGHSPVIRASGSWNDVGKEIEATLELQQLFTPTLSNIHIHTLSHSLDHGHGSNNQVHLSWDRGTPLNVTVTVSQQHWRQETSRGQACLYISPGQMQSVLPLPNARGCVSVSQEGKSSYSQSAELKWSDKRITQSLKYQRGSRGMHTVQVEAGLQNVSPSPCPSHSLVAQMHTNLRDVLEHHVLLGLCPSQPGVSWSGSHRVNSGKDVLYSRTGLSLSGQAVQHSTFILALRNASSSQRSNYSLLTEWKLGNWSIELGGSGHSSVRSTGLQVQAKLDRSELFWLQTMMGKRCLQAAVGYNGDLSDNLRTSLCMDGRHWLTFKAQREGSGIENETLALVSMGTANQSLIFQARGCEECLQGTEARLQQLGSHVKRKLLDRVQRLHHLLLEFRRQAGGSAALQELSDWPLRLTQKAEKLLLQRVALPWTVWTNGPLRHALKHSLPQTLHFLHHTSQLIQQELRKPLTTLAEAYYDVTGERVDAAWQEGLELWRRELEELLPAILHNHHLRTPSLSVLRTTIAALDLVSQQTVHWAEARLAAVLVGVRRQLAYTYKFSESREMREVTLRLPLPQTPWVKGSPGSGVVQVLLEEFLLKPLLSLNSASLTAELYRLKRRVMDSPFNHQAFLVADEFAVSFEGQLLELPASCDLLLAVDVISNTFSITLKSNKPKQHSLVVQLNNTTITIHPHAQVEVNCRTIHAPFTNPDATITRELNLLTVSNRRGLLVSCDPSLSMCSVTLDGWLHGIASGLLGTNDNEAGNEHPLLDGSQTQSLEEFTLDWQVDSSCISSREKTCQKQTPVESCTLLFSSTTSPLSSCFRVVDPDQFLAVCERSQCSTPDSSRSTLCRLASAYIQLCIRNYVPLESPIQCA